MSNQVFFFGVLWVAPSAYSTKIATLAQYQSLLQMAPRRNGHSAMDMHGLLGLDQVDDLHQLTLSSGHSTHHHRGVSLDNFTRCCVPSGDCFKAGVGADYGLINLDELRDCIRVICNNENCTAGQYMHRECFESWEQSVLSYLKSIGRARSWTDRQRQQNLWTKKGYDLVFKACGCKCNRGHLKKDLDWTPPIANNIFGRMDDESNKKRKKRNRNNQKPVLAIGIAPVGSNYHHNGGGGSQGSSNGPLSSGSSSSSTAGSSMLAAPIELRTRTGSLSSSNGSSSPPVSGSSEHSISPVHSAALIKKQKSKVEAYSDRVR